MGTFVAINHQLATLLVALVALVVAGGVIVAFVALMRPVVGWLAFGSWLDVAPERDVRPERDVTARRDEYEPAWWASFERQFASHVESLRR